MKLLCLLLSLLVFVVPDGTAAEGGAAAVPAVPGASETYLFAPGDVIEVTVSSHTGYDRTLTIQPDGRIQVPFVGEILASGRTAADLARQIQQGLTQELVDPRVTVSLRTTNPVPPRRLNVSLLGAVRNPGTYELRERGTLTELLAAAGGPLPTADLARITLARTAAPGNPDEGGRSTATGSPGSGLSGDPAGYPPQAGGVRSAPEVRTLDLSRNGQTGLIEGNVPLESGDLVIVPTGAATTVLVTGEVGRPGSLPLPEGGRLLDLLSQAGGATPKADLSLVGLTRAGQTRTLDLRALASGQAGGESVENPALQPGDLIAVPESKRFIHLLGAVARPDSYPITGTEHVFDLITRAGGVNPQADLAKTMLIRRDAQGQPQSQPLDLRRMMTKGDMKLNLPMQAGDVLVVPAKGPRGVSGLRSLGALILPFTGIFNLFR